MAASAEFLPRLHCAGAVGTELSIPDGNALPDGNGFREGSAFPSGNASGPVTGHVRACSIRVSPGDSRSTCAFSTTGSPVARATPSGSSASPCSRASAAAAPSVNSDGLEPIMIGCVVIVVDVAESTQVSVP